MTNEERIERNKKIIKDFPFLKPKNVFTGEVDKDFDYSYTLADDLPDGWRPLFFMFCTEIVKLYAEKGLPLESLHIVQLKEKYGELRFYHNGGPSELYDILWDYQIMSGYICATCGKIGHYLNTKGWLLPVCKKHKRPNLPYKYRQKTKSFYIDKFQDGKVTKIKHDLRHRWKSYKKNRKFFADNYGMEA